MRKSSTIEPTPTRIVTIPACDDHDGHARATVTLFWTCPTCGGPRGEPVPAISYDGSRRMAVDGWTNDCGHVDHYAAVRREAHNTLSAMSHRQETMSV